jgi:hypothetical protein
MNAWQEYKKKLGTTRPWDVLNPNAPKSSEEEAQQRLNICLDCERLVQLTKQCLECGCIMAVKVKLKNATCPLNKW